MEANISVKSADIRVMSFNVRGAVHKDGENAWDHRASLNLRTILSNNPDLIGFQEVQEGNLQKYQEMRDYDKYIGLQYGAREPWEYAAIYWKKDKLERINSGGFWLNEDCTQMGLGWDAACIRVATWCLFEHKASGLRFFHFNTHLDHEGRTARVEGTKKLLSQIESIVPNRFPVLITGDFNCTPETEPYKLFMDEGFKDAYLEAGCVEDEEGFTFHRFTGKPTHSGRIDWILVRDGNARWYIRSFHLDRTGEPPIFPSDHFPLIADLSLGQ